MNASLSDWASLEMSYGHDTSVTNALYRTTMVLASVSICTVFLIQTNAELYSLANVYGVQGGGTYAWAC